MADNLVNPQFFNFGQTFLLDAESVDNNVAVQLTAVDLFFIYKPDSINNRSGILNPGVTVYLTPTKFNIPQITKDTYTQFARAEWQQITTSSDASVPTRFTFNKPIKVNTGVQYAIVVVFDGNEAFFCWTAKNGY